MLADIQQLIAPELERYKAIFRSALQADNELLAAALTHLTRKLGKMMRPTLVILCAREGGAVTDEVLHAAAGLEMLHTASLVHDDVIDESAMRRGQRSVNALFDNKAAVLVGDFITSKALTEVALTHRLEVVSRMALLGQTLADGELLQLNSTHSTVFSEQAYYQVIAKRTAILFETCAYAGALLGGADADTIQRLEHFAHLVGLCFQMRDDIFDFDESLNVGKPKGNDLQEGKLTLPVIYALNQELSSLNPQPSTLNPQPSTLNHFGRLAMRVRALEASRLEIQELVDFTLQSGGIAYAESEMQRLANEARTLLSDLRDPAVAHALNLYLDYVINRTL